MPDASGLEPLASGATLGILGGGQLGRMLALAAAKLGLRCHVFDPDAGAPALAVAAEATIAHYDDELALQRFSRAVDVITYEFENVPYRTAAFLGEHLPVRPSPAALRRTQDRLSEKELVRSLGLKTARYASVEDEAGLAAALAVAGCPAVLKTRRFGYDGKGQVRIDRAEEAVAGFAAIGGRPAIVEAVVPFTRELSVVAARGSDGAFAAYDPIENEHRSGILRRSRVPATVAAATADRAVEAARRIGEALSFCGIFCVEFFVTGQGPGEDLLVNEIAPRVHNSGHWTVEACPFSQFEQHVRAVAGWPLASAGRHSDAVMENLIGDEILRRADLLAEPHTCLTEYGKREIRAGRKMGHLTRLSRPGRLGRDGQ